MYGPPYVIDTRDWRGRDIALSRRRWEDHIRYNRGWIDDVMLPFIRATIESPDAAFESDRSSREAEIWRHFDDIKDGTPDYLKVIVRYDTLIASATSGNIVTVYIVSRISSGGMQIWTRT
jgi:hypothetical protein